MFGWLSKRLTLEAYKTLLQRLETMDSRLRSLELEADDFRNKVLRKIQAPRKDKPLEVEEKKGGIIRPSEIAQYGAPIETEKRHRTGKESSK